MKRFLFLLSILAAVSVMAGEIPQSYLDEVKIQNERVFNRNSVMAFVYNIYYMFDKHVPVENFLQSLAARDLNMEFPEATLKSHADFQKWYKGIGDNIQTNTHTVESAAVKMNDDGTFGVHVVVFWQAASKKGGFLKFRADQNWIVIDDGGRLKIREYLVKEAK